MSKNGSYVGQAVRELVLGSASPRRRELVRQLGLRIPIRFEASDADESIPPGLAPAEAAERLALGKAAGVRKRLGAEAAGTVIVGADTIVVLDGAILGKPRDAADARRMLGQLQGRSHEVITGVAVLNGATGESKTARSITRVVMKPLDADRIARYVATGEPLDKAGGYDTTMHLGDIGQYRIISESPDGRPEIIVGHTVSKVTFRPMSDEEIWAYVKTGDPLDKAGAYGVQGIGSVFIEKIEGDFYSIMGLPLNLLYQMLLMFGISLFNQS